MPEHELTPGTSPSVTAAADTAASLDPVHAAAAGAANHAPGGDAPRAVDAAPPVDPERLAAAAAATAASAHPAAMHGIPELRGYFRTNEVPIYFISPTAFNLMGIDRWVRNFRYVNYFDSLEGMHPRVFVPTRIAHDQFTSIEDVCNYLLAHPEMEAYIEETSGVLVVDGAPDGSTGRAIFVFFDEDSERLAHELGLKVSMPPAELRKRLDSKIVTTQLGNEAGVPSVPNVLGHADSYEALKALAAEHGLGEDLVVQTPYGDSGKTTFYIRTEGDWNAHADSMVDEELKVMRRINPKAVAVEACITRCGTVVGPVMTELIGYKELTPYRGGWCGNEIYFGALSEQNRAQALEFTQRLGDRIAREGYHGLLEVDYLLDTDTGELYLGELNPRLSGISSMTNVSAGAYADMPLFLFHLAEYLELEYDVDVDEINKRWGSEAHTDEWSQIIIKETTDRVELLTEAPSSGTWRLDDDGQMGMVRPDLDWHSLHDLSEGFYLRILGPGDYRYEGADLGILVVRHRMQTDDGQLTEECRRWINAVRARFHGIPIGPSDPGPTFDALAVKAN